MRHPALAFVSIFALIISFAPACFANDAAKTQIWKADPKVVAGLGSEFVLEGESFRLPQNFTMTESRIQGHTQVLKWRGPAAENGIQPFFMVLERPMDTLSDDAKKDPSLNSTNAAAEFASLISGLISDPTKSTVEQGQINGLSFSRQYFKGYNHRWLKEIHGFTYSTITSRAIYLFLVWDEEPYSKYSVPMFEQSVLTFHPSDQPNTPTPENLIDPLDQKDDQSDN